MKPADRQSVYKPVRKYWYLSLAYILSTYALAQIIVWGSRGIAAATDRLFSGQILIIGELMIPFIILMLAGGLSAATGSYAKNSLSVRTQADIRNMLVSKLVRIPYSYLDTQGTGALMNKLLSDIGQLETLFSETMPEFLMMLVTTVTICTYIGTQSPRLLLVTLLCYPPLLWLAGQTGKKAGQAAAVRRSLYDELENTSYDTIQGILVGKTFNLYELQKQRIFHIIEQIVDNERWRTRILCITFFMEHLVRWIPKLICYLFCLYELNLGRLSIGAMLVYVMLLDKIAEPLGVIPRILVDIREYRISAQRIQQILDQEEEPSGTRNFEPEGDIVIELRHIRFGYSPDREILKDLNLTVRRGSNIAFVGSSGSGKTTVIKLLCGFYYPQQGTCRIYGHDFREWDIRSLRSKIGLVSQNVFLFPGTVAENISYGKPGASREEITDACRKANAHDFIMKLPMGYDTEVGERGTKLSGGQKQRLSIARAFLKDAPILLLDEPTSAVDVETEAGIQEALAKISENRTVITIAHRLSTIEDADEIYEFDGGEIVRHIVKNT